MKDRLDLAHCRRIEAILGGIPADCDLPHALVALEDAYVVAHMAHLCGLSLAGALKIHRENSDEETQRRVEESQP